MSKYVICENRDGYEMAAVGLDGGTEIVAWAKKRGDLPSAQEARRVLENRQKWRNSLGRNRPQPVLDENYW